MSTTITPASSTVAPDQRAANNFAMNCETLKRNQPDLLGLLPSLPEGTQWVLARDGSLTALDADENWYAGCSLPWRAARAMLKVLDLHSLFGCFLSPGWAAQLRLCLDLIEPRQGALAAYPDLGNLVIALHCEEFSEDIAAGRLWFAAGDQWDRQIEAVFDAQPGLMVPTQFIRTMSQHKDKIDAMIAPAQKAFADVTTRRGAAIAELREGQTAPRPNVVCVVCPSQFALWQEAGAAIAEAMESTGGVSTSSITRIDPDRCTSASPLALARATSGCDAMLIPDAGRGDLPGIVSTDVAWVTWVTRSGIPDAKAAGPRDRLLLADRAWQRAAIDAGWRKERTAIAEWPISPGNTHPTAKPPHLALIADTIPASAPKAVCDFSSQAILWDHIRRELLNDPFAVGDDVELFLTRLMRELEIAAEGLDRRVFISELVLPAYQHGIALHLVKSGIPLKIFGKGWDSVAALPECAALESAWGGPLRSTGELRIAIAAAAGLVQAWPSRSAHPIHRHGKPVLGPSLSSTAFLRDAGRLLRGGIPAAPPTSPFSLSQILKLREAA